MVAAASATVPLPDSLSYSEAAPFLCAGYTVWSAIKAVRPKPGDRIAVLGIGGLGHLAIQFSKVLGFETAAITRSPDKLSLAKALGADHAFLRVDQLRELGGVDVILATCNSFRLATEALPGLRPEGSMVLLGLSQEPFTVTNSLLFARQRIIGTFPSSREDLYEVLKLAGSRKVAAKIETYPLGRITDAYDRVANGTVRFRAVITDGAP